MIDLMANQVPEFRPGPFDELDMGPGVEGCWRMVEPVVAGALAKKAATATGSCERPLAIPDEANTDAAPPKVQVAAPVGCRIP